MAKKTKTAGEAAQNLAANKVEETPTTNTGNPEGDGTEGNGTDGDGSEGDGTDGDGSEGDGTDGDGSEGDGTDGDGSEGDGTDGIGTEGNGSEGDDTDGIGTEGNGSEGEGSEGDSSEGDGSQTDDLEDLETLEEFTRDLQGAYNDKIGDLAAALFEPLFHVLNDQKYRVGGSKAVEAQGPGKLTEDQRELLIKSNQDRAAEQLKKIREGQVKAAQKKN